MDFSLLISAVNIDALIGGITAIAALKILPSIWRWAYDHVIDWFTPEIRSESVYDDNGDLTVILHHKSAPSYVDEDTGENLVWNDSKGDFVTESYASHFDSNLSDDFAFDDR